MKKEIIFLLTHKYNNQISNNIHKIYKEKGERDLYVLTHGNVDFGNLPASICSFSLEDLRSLNFTWLKENKLVPGSAHLPLIYYFQQFPGYDYYWLVEYDVEFGGEWKSLFNTYRDCEADFISSYITHYESENSRDWPWWNIDHPQKMIPKSERVRSFNPIYRISNQALRFLLDELSTGWRGHYEVLLSTILYQNNFQLLDFGNGDFSSRRYPTFYTRNFFKKSMFRFFDFLKFGTMRYTPPMKKVGYRKLLYHPVKEENGITKSKELLQKLKETKKRLTKR